jgi:DNA-binding GntR family transcriptional regulator
MTTTAAKETAQRRKGDATRLAVEGVRALIQKGKLRPGEKLLEVELAVALGVSRTPVREALRILGREHVVRFVPGEGVFVTAWSQADMEELIALRGMLEGFAAERAASRVTMVELADLTAIAERMEAATAALTDPAADRQRLFDTIRELNTQFHAGVAAASRGLRTQELITALAKVPLKWKGGTGAPPATYLAQVNAHHRQILAALQQRDPAAARLAMTSHLDDARAGFL